MALHDWPVPRPASVAVADGNVYVALAVVLNVEVLLTVGMYEPLPVVESVVPHEAPPLTCGMPVPEGQVIEPLALWHVPSKPGYIVPEQPVKRLKMSAYPAAVVPPEPLALRRLLPEVAGS
jgi:hypothetical protein